MTTIGFIGAGNIGGTVARLAVDAGYDVALSNSRGPETLASLTAELGPKARAATPAEAAAAGDIVVVTIPLKNIEELPVDALAGKTIIDTNNYYPERDGQIAALDDGSTTTSELLQALIPTADVVKAFNNIYSGHLAVLGRPSGAPHRSALPIAGDSEEAKATVTAFLDAIGYDVVDAGPLSEGWRFQKDTPAYGLQYAADPGNWPSGERAAGAEEVRQLLANAVR
ncbi:MAG TPA: NAD(P)-binding domain-containing protein [Aeromicrobium sp.]|nr:NAD(P)-binding domain-containing protein [Aeromicrobium sp.]